MFKIDGKKISANKCLLLAPMEAVTDLSYRIICKEFGAEVVYTEFVNSDGIARKIKRLNEKMAFIEKERPIGIQLYGQQTGTSLYRKGSPKPIFFPKRNALRRIRRITYPLPSLEGITPSAIEKTRVRI